MRDLKSRLACLLVHKRGCYMDLPKADWLKVCANSDTYSLYYGYVIDADQKTIDKQLFVLRNGTVVEPVSNKGKSLCYMGIKLDKETISKKDWATNFERKDWFDKNYKNQ